MQAQPLQSAPSDSLPVYHAQLAAPATPVARKSAKRQLLERLKQLSVSEAPCNEADKQQLYQVAGLLTRMRLYPLAMKCFFKTMVPDSLVEGHLPLTNADEQQLEIPLEGQATVQNTINSKFINANNVLATFDDGKKAMAYAMIFHVRQPVRGKARSHKLAYTGHTYITLIKFNVDSSYTTMSFGFGPKKDNFLSATPIVPTTSSTMRDDAAYPWDQVVGKFISRRRFEKILQLAHQYDGLAYNLNKNNCTDFGLKAAHVAGLEVQDTRSSWLLGGGNNPGKTGQSILHGKFSNLDSGDKSRLYIDTARVAPLITSVE